MFDFLKTHQLNIMLYMSGICGILVVLTLMTKTLSNRRRRMFGRSARNSANAQSFGLSFVITVFSMSIANLS